VFCEDNSWPTTFHDIILIAHHFFAYVTGQEMAIKKEKMKNILTKISHFTQNRELSAQNESLRNLFNSVHDALIRLQNSVKETHQLDVVKNKGKEEDTCHKVEVLQRPFSSGYHPPIPGYSDFDAQPQRDIELWTRSEPPMPEFIDARGMPQGMAPGAEEQGKDMDMIHMKGRDYVPTQTSYRTEYLTQLEPVQIDMEWTSILQNCSLFDADPFQLLIVLLSVSYCPLSKCLCGTNISGTTFVEIVISLFI